MPPREADPLGSWSSSGPIALAHRGGHGGPADPPENTLAAFVRAAELGVVHLETDVQVSADGVVFAFHDDRLDRLTDLHGPVAELSAAEIRRALVHGREPVPELRELLAELPGCRFNIDVKHDAAVAPTVREIVAADAVDRVCLASFSHRRLVRLRRLLPAVRTSCSPWEVAWLRVGPTRNVRAAAARGGATCVQVSRRWGPVPLVEPRFVQHAHELGLDVHVWTVNDPGEMAELLEVGVDGIMTDRPDLLVPLLDDLGSDGGPDGGRR